jgi:hypothetical protein
MVFVIKLREKLILRKGIAIAISIDSIEVYLEKYF